MPALLYYDKGGKHMMLKTCPRCGRLMKYGRDYCGDCLKKVEEDRKERDRRYNKTRDQKYLTFYNSKEWKDLSRTYTATKHYRCEECGAIGRDVHHKAPIQTEYGWRHRLDEANLILLCVNCHNKKHGRFRKRGEKGECKDE